MYMYEHEAHLSRGTCASIECLIFTCYFPQKSPMINGSFAERDLQQKETWRQTSTHMCKLLISISHSIESTVYI